MLRPYKFLTNPALFLFFSHRPVSVVKNSHFELDKLKYRSSLSLDSDSGIFSTFFTMSILWKVRFGVFAVTLFFSLIMLGVSAGYIGQAANIGGGAPNFSIFGLVVALLTMFSIGPMFAIDFIRRGAITSWIVVELSVIGLLWILWLASAATTSSVTGGATVDCGFTLSGAGNNLCHLYQAIEAFGFINWLIFLGYWITLLVFALRSHLQGDMTVWQGTVRDNAFSKGTSGSGPDVPMTQQPDVGGQPQTYSSVPTGSHA